MSQQSSAKKSCSELEIQCVIQIPPKFVDTEAYFHSNSIPARISQLECKIEALLCQLPARQPRRSRLMRYKSLSSPYLRKCKVLEFIGSFKYIYDLKVMQYQVFHNSVFLDSKTSIQFNLNH